VYQAKETNSTYKQAIYSSRGNPFPDQSGGMNADSLLNSRQAFIDGSFD